MNGVLSDAFSTLHARLNAHSARDQAADGHFYVAVRTTGIFCLPSCPARPKPENVVFFDSRENCLAEGFRACKRCKP